MLACWLTESPVNETSAVAEFHETYVVLQLSLKLDAHTVMRRIICHLEMTALPQFGD